MQNIYHLHMYYNIDPQPCPKTTTNPQTNYYFPPHLSLSPLLEHSGDIVGSIEVGSSLWFKGTAAHCSPIIAQVLVELKQEISLKIEEQQLVTCAHQRFVALYKSMYEYVEACMYAVGGECQVERERGNGGKNEGRG